MVIGQNWIGIPITWMLIVTSVSKGVICAMSVNQCSWIWKVNLLSTLAIPSPQTTRKKYDNQRNISHQVDNLSEQQLDKHCY